MKPKVEHCPLQCHIHSPDIPKWHYRVVANGSYPFWGTWNDCIKWVTKNHTKIA